MRFTGAGAHRRRAELWIKRGDDARGRRDWTAAAVAYKKVVALLPALTPAWVQYGHALKESGQPQLAEQAYRMAIAQAGDDADAHLQLGHLLKRQHRPAEAAGEYCAAALLNPTNDSARQELAALGYAIADDDGRARLEALAEQVRTRGAELETEAVARRNLEQQIEAFRVELIEAQELVIDREGHWATIRERAQQATHAAAELRDELERVRAELASTAARAADVENEKAAALAQLATAEANLAEQRARLAYLEEQVAPGGEAQGAGLSPDQDNAPDETASPAQHDSGSAVAELIKYSISSIKNSQLQDYAATGYTSIDGWGINHYLVHLFLALDAYQKERNITGNLFEIGVYHGRVLILLGLMSRGDERIVGLDIFEALQSHNIDASGGPTTKEIVDRHLDRYRLSGKTDLIAGDSLFTDFTKIPALSGVRFAHIDGAHYVDAVVNDLMKTQQLLVPGGIIVVDDFLHVGFPGVNEGCHRFLSSETPRLVIPFAAGANKLFLTTHSHHADLLGYMREILVPPNGKAIKLHGFDAVSLEPA